MSAATHLVWIDLEMTGLDPDHCHILEIATIITTSELELVAEGPDIRVRAGEAELATLSDWSREHFTASGLLAACAESNTSLAEAEQQTVAFILEHCEAGKSPLCGNSVHTDRAFLYRHMRTLHDVLHYRNIDVSSFKEVLRRWYPAHYAPPTKAGRHEALADIRESIDELRYYRRVFLRPDPDPGADAGATA